MTVKECVDTARCFAAGCMSMGLVPQVDAEGKKWRFLGIQSRNRAEWALCHWGNMHNQTTTVALYETLGSPASNDMHSQETMKYVINQTELITIACS